MGRRGMRIGLTGGIASGKSTVAQRFQELGAASIVENLNDRSSTVIFDATRRFGSHLLTDSGELDRRALRNLIFSDPARRRELESILHPLIRADMKSRADASPGPYLVMAIPLLVEGGALHRVDRILVVDVPEDVQLKRVMGRDGATLEQAHSILAAQASRETRIKAADDILLNAGTVPELRQSVDRLHESYLRLAEAAAP